MTTEKRNIDELDARIIAMLQSDGRMSNTEIGKSLAVSEATIRGRIKRLIDDEVIQIVAESNPLNLGFEITGDLYRMNEGKLPFVERPGNPAPTVGNEWMTLVRLSGVLRLNQR
ncbi:AsnC-type helix-turn-helix domain-containing protein [Syntrophus gentianae]|uniref:AsnC-type helix-turn-helix domain-containing protein n=1 Tax=Syntrophus gentianae TaxID=43775 RepID=A0A1H7Y1E7_9BACT|nr:AsnC family transcriptional regulator [Syntrophus gentianae]SEM39920.1 AsnC-type helix-turn-helix domain-containing protein [Syntrophus gentianae]